MTYAQAIEDLRQQIEEALEWLYRRPQTPQVTEVMEIFREALAVDD